MVCLGMIPETSMTAAVWMTTEMPWQALLRYWASRMSPSSTDTFVFVLRSAEHKAGHREALLWAEMFPVNRCLLPMPPRIVIVERIVMF